MRWPTRNFASGRRFVASGLGGLMAMMPAFATDDAADINATSTIDVVRLYIAGILVASCRR
jgi:hypothetical protein